MLKNHFQTLKELVLAVVAVFFALSVHGSLPFLMAPTLGQSVWTMGFAQSFVHGPLFGVYAHDIGIPKPAAIAFGLAGSWPASLLIRLGWSPADAYSGMNAFWLGLAFFSAYKIGRRFKASRSVALLGAVAWSSMPIIWAHTEYSMLSLGIALLSFYFLSAIRLFLIESPETKVSPSGIALYFFAAVVAVFMDGYTFVLFAVGASILLGYSWLIQPEKRTPLLRVAVPTHVLSFALAYVLFSTYIGKAGFSPQSIDFFRGWGLDLSFLVIPSRGVLWVADVLGLSLHRTDEYYFGDGSVWNTTFALPVLVLGLVAWWHSRKRLKIVNGILLVTVVGFYMALGPSLKVNSTKPESLRLSHPHQQSALMSSEWAVGPTGSAWLSEKLPGFKVMRASYRWAALGIFGAWLLMMIGWSRTSGGSKRLWALGVFALILLNLPNLQMRWAKNISSRGMFQQIDQELITELRRHIQPNETVAFIPWRNDFIANYLAPGAGFRTFNIGGDKNLHAAQTEWPTGLLPIDGELTQPKALASLMLLMDRASDVLIVPYFHTLWAAHRWPCNAPFPCPAEKRTELQPVLTALKKLPYLDVLDTPLFATIRLSTRLSEEERLSLVRASLASIRYPIPLKEVSYVLQEGWHLPELDHVWSRAEAKLRLPAPKECKSAPCEAVLSFSVFGADPKRPLSVRVSSDDAEWKWSQEVVARSGQEVMEVRVSLVGAKGVRNLSISVPEATSPQKLVGIPDGRVLGINLQKIELLRSPSAQAL